MNIVLSLILFIIFTMFTLNIVRGGFGKWREMSVPGMEGYVYEMNPMMFLIIFITISAPCFLSQPFTQFKYFVYFAVLIWFVATKQFEYSRSAIINSYWIFYLYLLIRLIGSEYVSEGLMLLIKYAIPILSLYLGYTAIQNKYDLYHYLKIVAISTLIYTFLIGGMSAKFYDWLYWSPIFKLFLKYAGFADYLTSLFAIPFLLAWWTGEKKWYWVAASMFLSTLLEVVRTGLGGMAIAASIFLFMRYKAKSLPYLALAAVVSLCVVLFVPEVNEKFFGANAGKVTAENIVYDNAMSFDNIQTNARGFTWEIVMDRCYDNHEMFGSGLGSGNSVTKILKRTHRYNIPELLHSDYVQMLCDGGIIAVVLFAFFYLTLFFTVFKYTWLSNNLYLKITGILSLSSMSGIAFAMAFDNVVSHSMTSMIFPFIFTGFFLKFIDLEKHDELS